MDFSKFLSILILIAVVVLLMGIFPTVAVGLTAISIVALFLMNRA